jgi:hypothetical protein
MSIEKINTDNKYNEQDNCLSSARCDSSPYISMPISETISNSATRNAYDIDSLNLLVVSVLQVY